MKKGVMKRRNPPGHIGLISENQPGITADMLLVSSISTETTPLSFPSLGLFTGKSVGTETTTPLSSAINKKIVLCAPNNKTLETTQSQSTRIYIKK